MAQNLTNVSITVNRVTKKGVVSGDLLQIRDEAVELTLVNVTQDDIEAGLVFSIFRGDTEFAKCSSWTVNGEGDAVGTLNTNTTQFDTLFSGASPRSSKWLDYRIYATNLQVPICCDRILVGNFTGDVTGTPTTIASPAEVLAAMQAEIEAATAAVEELDTEVQNLASQVSAAISDIDTHINLAIASHDGNALAHSAIRNRITAVELKLDLSAISTINESTGTLKQTKALLNALITQLKV